MKINPITYNINKYKTQTSNRPKMFEQDCCGEIVSFSAKKSLYQKDKLLKKLEGAQNGIKVFEGLTLKEIAFIGKDLAAIAVRQGCNSNCKHCYADAHPPLKETENTINSASFEDIKYLLDGFKELKERTGHNFIQQDFQNRELTLIFDADNIDIEIKDKAGQTYEFPELNKMMYEATGICGLFDTSGWNVKSKKHQERAERIVKYYLNPENRKELYQFNISINPFHSIIAKSLEQKEKGNLLNAKILREIYVERISNALFTFIPLLDWKEFGAIIRAFPEELLPMDGYNRNDTEKLLLEIRKRFSEKCDLDLKNEKKYIKTARDYNKYINIINSKLMIPDENIIAGKRIQELIKSKHPNIKESELKSSELAIPKQDSQKKLMKKLRSEYNEDGYLKIIDITGKIYVNDNFRVIPTELQLNYDNKNKKADTFHPISDKYTITKQIINEGNIFSKIGKMLRKKQ